MDSNILTNEESRVFVYSGNSLPTNASEITPESSLADLNLNWREKDLPEKIRTKHVHRLHPYLGKFIPQLVEVFLRKYFKPGDTVLDPFAGSGTTLVQANELGINSIGYDISAFNVLLSKVKTSKYDLRVLRKEINDALAKTDEYVLDNSNDYQMNLWNSRISSNEACTDEYLLKWFAPNALLQLLTYLNVINHNNYQYSDVLRIILSRSARSARLTTHFDLDFPKKPQTEEYYCYKHGRMCKPTQDAMQFLKRYSNDTIRRIEEYSLIRTDATVELNHADSRFIKFPNIDGVVTSPPYVGLIDYHAQHEYSYHLLGLDDNRNLEIGPATNGTGQKAKFDYQKDITKVFDNALKSMKRGGRVIVVANDRNDLYPKIGDDLNINVEAVIKRHVNRRTGRRSSEFFESIFIWKKR